MCEGDRRECCDDDENNCGCECIEKTVVVVILLNCFNHWINYTSRAIYKDLQDKRIKEFQDNFEKCTKIRPFIPDSVNGGNNVCILQIYLLQGDIKNLKKYNFFLEHWKRM